MEVHDLNTFLHCSALMHLLKGRVEIKAFFYTSVKCSVANFHVTERTQEDPAPKGTRADLGPSGDGTLMSA